MKTIDDIFNLIKQTVNLSGKIDDYNIRLSNSVFDRENLIGVYRIRKGVASRKENYKLAQQMDRLLIGLQNTSGILLKGVNIKGENYSGMYYLSDNYEKVIGYLESELDENGNLIN
ncbi:enoyl-CoA hydratase [Chryseobacterium lactis]|uniref:enoyl-CoA hydratase n=1 Tax=Chryseobacterium lactis TaxID=1241981 RepID=UPI001627E2E2|nr:enoyl-CoA hydratase [Chryseobacterium lactis]